MEFSSTVVIQNSLLILKNQNICQASFMLVGVCYNNVQKQYKSSRLLHLIQLFYITYLLTMSESTKASKPLKIDLIDQQEEIEVPLKKQQANEKMICQIHSTEYRKEEIKFINLGFIAKNRAELFRTFLCDICLKIYRSKNPSNDDLKKIQSLKRFQYKYIESVLQKYQNDKYEETSNLLKEAQKYFCDGIDKLNKKFTQICEVYQKNIKEMFHTLRNPINSNQLELFLKGKMNEGMIEEFYHNYKKIIKYEVLLGNKNKQVLEGVTHGFEASTQKMEQDFKGLMGQSFDIIKKYISNYEKENQKSEKVEKIVPQNQQKRQISPTIQQIKPKKLIGNAQQASQNANNLFSQRKISKKQSDQKKQIKKKKEVKDAKRKIQRKPNSPSSDSSSENSSQSSQSSEYNQKHRVSRAQNRQRILQQRREKERQHKYKIIQKQIRDKPFRNDRIDMIDEEFMKDSRNRVALYIVIKANTERSGSERVHRMDIHEFKKRYPQAFNRYVRIRQTGK